MPKRFRPDRRVTMPLTGSLRHGELRLCFRSLVSTHFALHALARHSNLRPTLSAITRKALADYARRVDQMTPDQLQSEARSVLAASKAFTPEPGTLERAIAALEASGEGNPLPSLDGVLRGSDTGLGADALMEQVDRMLKTTHPKKFKHL